jgi:hypothetical protein
VLKETGLKGAKKHKEDNDQLVPGLRALRWLADLAT